MPAATTIALNATVQRQVHGMDQLFLDLAMVFQIFVVWRLEHEVWTTSSLWSITKRRELLVHSARTPP